MSEETHYHDWVNFFIMDKYPIRRLCITCGRIEVLLLVDVNEQASKNYDEKDRKTDRWVEWSGDVR